MTALRLGTRGSRLALVQSELVAGMLRRAHPNLAIEFVIIESSGDLDRTTPLSSGEGAGWFTSALQERLLAGDVDFLVHSYKDLPTARPEGLEIAAVPARADPYDALVSRHRIALRDLPAGATIGTSSPRRSAQLRAIRPDLAYRTIRGNVETRIAKVDSGEFDATVLARAGLERLGLLGRVCETFSPAEVLPAPAQGALAVECRSDATGLRDLLLVIDSPDTRRIVECERRFLAELEAGCAFPAGAYAENLGGVLRLSAFAEIDGDLRRDSREGPDGQALAAALAADLLGGQMR